jgi:hypothetical protein
MVVIETKSEIMEANGGHKMASHFNNGEHFIRHSYTLL